MLTINKFKIFQRKSKKYTTLCLNENKKMFVIKMSLIRQHLKSFDYKNNDKYMQTQKFSRKVREESVEDI